jgi:hypothetical protein
VTDCTGYPGGRGKQSDDHGGPASAHEISLPTRFLTSRDHRSHHGRGWLFAISVTTAKLHL